MSIWPKALSRLRHGVVDAGLIGDVHLDGDGGLTNVARGLSGAGNVDVRDRHARAFGHIGLAQRQARCLGQRQ